MQSNQPADVTPLLLTQYSHSLSEKYLGKGPVSVSRPVAKSLTEGPMALYDTQNDPRVQYVVKIAGMVIDLTRLIQGQNEYIDILKRSTCTSFYNFKYCATFSGGGRRSC